MKCPSCGGKLVYSISLKKLECEHCKSTFDVETYSEKNEGTKNSDSFLQMDTYCCKNCGAELQAPSEQTVAYCMYCGGQATLMDKTQGMERPLRIQPFSLTKDEAKKKFSEKIDSIMFVPKGYSDPKFIEGFRGIYIPYWFAKADVEKTDVFKLKGKTFHVESGYDVTRHYEMNAQIGGTMDAGCYDASAAFDDTIAAEIAPFYSDDTVPFKEGYLAGFYSDKATSSLENYSEVITDEVAHNLKAEVYHATKEKVTVDPDELKKHIKWSPKSSKTVLFPVWFLTWRNKDRVAYGVMNGASGKMSIDVPVDTKRYFKVGAIATLILFAIMSLFQGFIIPLKVAAISSYFTFISSLIFKSELRSIRLKENHVFDWGYKSDADKKQLTTKRNKYIVMEKINIAIGIIIGVVMSFNVFSIIAIQTPLHLSRIFRPMMIFQAYIAIKQIMQVRKLKVKIAYLPIIFSILAVLAGIIVPGIARPQDYWYYGIAIGCFTAMILNTYFSVYYINYLTTRPVPNFFTREGANNGKK